MCNVKNAAINMNVSSEQMLMSLMIFAILHPAAINDEQLDITAKPKTTSNVYPQEQ